MSDLARLQANIAASVLSGDTTDPDLLAAVVESGPLTKAERLNIHINTYRETLGAAIRNRFPVVEVFVGEEFLVKLAQAYVLKSPPRSASLRDCLYEFPAFIRTFEPVAHIPYLADLAALEFLVQEVQERAPGPVLSETAANARLQSARALTLAEHVSAIESDYPIISFWMVGQGQLQPEAVHQNSGGEAALVAQVDGGVQILPLDANTMSYLTVSKERIEVSRLSLDQNTISRLSELAAWPVFALESGETA